MGRVSSVLGVPSLLETRLRLIPAHIPHPLLRFLRISFSTRTSGVIYLQNGGIGHLEYSISLGWGAAREPESSIDTALLCEGALFEARPDRQDTSRKLQKRVTSCYE